MPAPVKGFLTVDSGGFRLIRRSSKEVQKKFEKNVYSSAYFGHEPFGKLIIFTIRCFLSLLKYLYPFFLYLSGH